MSFILKYFNFHSTFFVWEVFIRTTHKLTIKTCNLGFYNLSKIVGESVSYKAIGFYNCAPKNISVKIILFVGLFLFEDLGLILQSILLSFTLYVYFIKIFHLRFRYKLDTIVSLLLLSLRILLFFIKVSMKLEYEHNRFSLTLIYKDDVIKPNFILLEWSEIIKTCFKFFKIKIT